MTAELAGVQDAADVEKNDSYTSEFSIGVIRGLIKQDIEVKSISTEACFVVAKAMEQLVEGLTKRASESMLTRNGETLEYNDVAHAVVGWPALDFLDDVIPQKISAATAVARMTSTKPSGA